MSLSEILPVNPFPDFLFVDCEASCLPVVENGVLIRPSFPIEVGLAACNGWSEAHLIKPVAEWESWPWSQEAEKLHGIAMSDLQSGKDVVWMAKWLNRTCRGKRVFTDNLSHERFWLVQIFQQAGIAAEFGLNDTDELELALAQKAGLTPTEFDRINKNTIRQYPRPHRAGPDALNSAMLVTELWRRTQPGFGGPTP